MLRGLAFVFVLPLCPMVAAAADAPVIHYRFDAAPHGVVTNLAGADFTGALRGGARIAPRLEGRESARLSLDGKTGFIEVQGAENLHLGPKGLSVLATVRFAPATAPGPNDVDMILFKNGEFLIGRMGDKLYFNLHDGTDWKSHVLAGRLPRGEWCHVAVIVTRQLDPAQGINGYSVRMFINGEAVKEVELRDREVPATSHPVDVGKGFGGPWFCEGDLAELAVYPRPLLDDELNTLLAAEMLATVTVRHITQPDPRFAALLAELRGGLQQQGIATRLPVARLLAAVEQASPHVASEADLLPFLATLKKLSTTSPDPVADFAAAHPEFTFLDNGQMGLVFYAQRPTSVALCGLYDFTARRELLGRQRPLWTLRYAPAAGGETQAIDSVSPALAASLNVDRLTNEALLAWRHPATEQHPIAFTARARLRLNDRRVSLDFEVTDTSAEMAVREAVFPIIHLRRLEHGVDRLLVPTQSGELHDDPVTALFRFEGQYPGGNAAMQFFSYYDAHQGIYVACEDPRGRSKTLRAVAAGNDCQISCRWFVGGPPGGGGNGFITSGQAVVEGFAGDWFDAAQLYKTFARTAAWWPASHSREDTPEWYRNLSIWFQGCVNTEKDVAELIAMRDYLQLPIGVHAYGWSEAPWPAFTGHPHFTPPKPGFDSRVAKLQGHSVHVKPYINARLWDTHDRASPTSDPESAEYLRVARPHAVKLHDQAVCSENYEGRRYAVMCPATSFWQGVVKQLCTTVAGYGVDGIYFDQVAAGAPAICFDPSHSHETGSGETWLERGYWPMLAAIRSDLKPRHPQLVFDSEDAAEPYMHLLDGFLPWRFIDVGHVPAYQAIYAGRVQMTGRVNTAEPKGKFVVAAEQMLFGEQIGWFGVATLKRTPPLGLFVKKLAHTRQAFLRFFNEGDMLKPAAWASPVAAVTADWGYSGARITTTPALMHAAWQQGDAIVVIIVNTTPDHVTADLMPPAKAWSLPEQVMLTEVQENAAPQTTAWTTENPRPISVPGLSVAAWLIGANDTLVAEVAAAFSTIGEFEER